MKSTKEKLAVFSIFAVVFALVIVMATGCTKALIAVGPDSVEATVDVQAGDVGATVTVETTPDGVITDSDVVISAPGILPAIYFDFDSAYIRNDAMIELFAVAATMKEFHSMALVVEGHTDERGTTEYNQALGQRRANAVKNYLMILGVDGARIATASHGEERPVCYAYSVDTPVPTEECNQANRRAEFVVSHEF